MNQSLNHRKAQATVKLTSSPDGIGLEYLNVSKDELHSPLVSPARLDIASGNASDNANQDENGAEVPAWQPHHQQQFISTSPLKSLSVNLKTSPESPFQKVQKQSRHLSHGPEPPPKQQQQQQQQQQKTLTSDPIARTSIDLLNPSHTAMESLSNYNKELAQTEDFEAMETLARTPDAKICAHSPFSAYLTDNDGREDSPASLASLSPPQDPPAVTTTARTALDFTSPEPTNLPSTPAPPDTYSKYMCTPESDGQGSKPPSLNPEAGGSGGSKR